MSLDAQLIVTDWVWGRRIKEQEDQGPRFWLQHLGSVGTFTEAGALQDELEEPEAADRGSALRTD